VRCPRCHRAAGSTGAHIQKGREDMLKKFVCNIAVLGMALCGMSFETQAQTPSHEAAKNLVKKAIAHLQKVGIDAACKDFADPAGGFINGEMYILVTDLQAKMICHATNPRMNGKSLMEIRDVDGKQFNKEAAEIAKEQGKGWVDYRWVNPVTKEIELKSTYFERTGDFSVACGIYRNKK
jgi:signal transduction histidine kinase